MPPVETVYLIHHSHTDVGYTLDQPVVWDMHTRFIDQALDLAEKYADLDSDGAFRWTVETTSVLQRWLEYATERDVERFIAMERAGRIEVTGMFANLTPLFDTDQLIETFQPLRRLRADYGFRIHHAMNCDVNGENWPLVDVLLDLDIRGFTMAINSHFGGPFQPRPYTFYWEGPSTRKIGVFNGWPYDKGWRSGIGRDADELADFWWPRLQTHLDEIGYPLPILLIQSYHPYGDNGSAFEDFTPFIDAWNAEGKSPRLVMATPRMWWAAVAEHADLLETYRGDWTDYWNFGSASSAREQAMNRRSRARLRSADMLYAAARELEEDSPVPVRRWAAGSFARYRQQAWESLHLWDEHTWGADCSIRMPGAEDTASQWYHKASYAYNARSLSLLLQRDAIAELAQHIRRENGDDILVFNPLPWPQTVAGEVPTYVLQPRGTMDDTTAGRHHQDRDDGRIPEEGRLLLPPTKLPGFGYAVVPRTKLLDDEVLDSVEDAAVENHRFRLTFDRDTGGIVSVYDKQLDWEWVERDGDYRFNEYVHEQVADTLEPWPRSLMFVQKWDIPRAEIPSGWKPGWRAKRSLSEGVIYHRATRTPNGWEIVQKLRAPGCVGPLTQRVFLPDYADYIECLAEYDLGLTDHPESTYFLFPFNVPGAVARFDVGGQAVIPGEEQLPGACRDYFTVQGWVDFSNQERGVTIAMPENPMVQLGDFHFGRYQSDFTLKAPLLLGWPTNNYWETNFRAHQPGRIRAVYRIYPHGGPFDEARAHRCGLEAAHDRPVFQHLNEATASRPGLPAAGGSLLELPAPPVIPLHIKRAEGDDGFIVRLHNASDEPQSARIGSGLLRFEGAQLCDLLENAKEALPVKNGSVTLELPPRRIVVVHLR
jgi:alpha-mannosidase